VAKGNARGWNTHESILGNSIGAPLFPGWMVTQATFPPAFQLLYNSSEKRAGWNTHESILGKSIGAPLFRGVVVTPLIFPPKFQPLSLTRNSGNKSEFIKTSDPSSIFAVFFTENCLVHDLFLSRALVLQRKSAGGTGMLGSESSSVSLSIAASASGEISIAGSSFDGAVKFRFMYQL
jgi:hypothetical protein